MPAAIDVRSVVEGALKLMDPWSLPLILNGQEFATREPTAAVVAGLRQVKELENDAMFALFDELFDPPARPPLRAWHAKGLVRDEELVAVVCLVLKEMKGRNSKNC